MLLLFETPAGYSLFKVKDEGKLENAEVRVSAQKYIACPQHSQRHNPPIFSSQ